MSPQNGLDVFEWVPLLMLVYPHILACRSQASQSMGRQVERSGLRFLLVKEIQAASTVPTHQKGPPAVACNGQKQLTAMTSRR